MHEISHEKKSTHLPDDVEALKKIIIDRDTAKYSDHLPLYRQEQIFQRIDVDIKRATFSTWVFRCALLLAPPRAECAYYGSKN